MSVLSFGCTEKHPSAFCRGDDVAPAECKIPVMYIYMDSVQCERIHHDKNERVNANLKLIAFGDTLYDGEVQIKTRGNNSWHFEKKPYSLKFPVKQRFFKLERGKSYVLLHNMLPYGGILQNSIAFKLGKVIGLPSPQDAVFLRVYVNGDYRGLYQMTNKVEVGSMRVNIRNLDKQNKRLNVVQLGDCSSFEKGEIYRPGHRKGMCLPIEDDDCSGGFLLDGVTRRAMYKDIGGFVSDSGSLIRIREPKYASEKAVDYIADLYNQMEMTVRNPIGIHPINGKKWDEYLDVKSFARYYILQEVMQNGDAGMNSFLMYKDVDAVDEKIYAGPIWDFDWLLRNHEQELWACARQSGTKNVLSSGGLLHFLWQHEEFKEQAKYDYINILYPAIENLLTSGYIDSLRNVLYSEAIADSIRWGVPWCMSVRNSFDYAKNRLICRSEFLHSIWSEDSTNWVCVNLQGTIFPARDVYAYGPKTQGVRLPSMSYAEPNVPHFSYWDAETGVELVSDTILYKNCVVNVRYRYPSWCEIQLRRCVRKLYEWGVVRKSRNVKIKHKM